VQSEAEYWSRIYCDPNGRPEHYALCQSCALDFYFFLNIRWTVSTVSGNAHELKSPDFSGDKVKEQFLSSGWLLETICSVFE